MVLQSGQILESFDFHMVLFGEISGRVVDQNKEPVPGIAVFLAVQEYVSGALRAVFTGAATTDDQGQYRLGRVQGGRAYVVLAKRRTLNLPAISDAPADVKLRRPAVLPTYYPNSRSFEGAETVILRDGEQREGVDIRLLRTPSFCVEGTMEGGTDPSKLQFGIAETQPTSGTSGNGGFYNSSPGGKPGTDGKVRICDLHPGDHELTLNQYSKPGTGLDFFGSAVVTITDRDVQNVRVSARPRIAFSGETVWDGPAPDPPMDGTLKLSLQALSRTERGFADSSLPGQFSIPNGLFSDDFSVRVTGVPKGVYIKDMTYGGRSILYEPLRLGSSMGDGGLRILLARNGGMASARVTDKDGNPVPDCSVVMVPASAANEAILSAAFTTGKTNTQGTWTSSMLAPGKYYVLATNDGIDKSVETVAMLWAARTRGQEVDLSPNGTANVTLTPRSIK